jgi:hypothetical protein
MPRQIITTANAPSSPLYSQGVRQALTNCNAILEAGILLTDPVDFAGLNEEYAQWFQSEPRTRYVAKLGVDLPGLLVSIRMTALVT